MLLIIHDSEDFSVRWPTCWSWVESIGAWSVVGFRVEIYPCLNHLCLLLSSIYGKRLALYIYPRTTCNSSHYFSYNFKYPHWMKIVVWLKKIIVFTTIDDRVTLHIEWSLVVCCKTKLKMKTLKIILWEKKLQWNWLS